METLPHGEGRAARKTGTEESMVDHRLTARRLDSAATTANAAPEAPHRGIRIQIQSDPDDQADRDRHDQTAAPARSHQQMGGEGVGEDRDERYS